MGFKITVSRFVGVFFVAALASGANAARSPEYPAQGLKADGLRLQGMAERYAQIQRLAGTYASPQIVPNDGFDWSDAGIGAAGGLGFVVVGGALLIGARRMRRTRVAV